MTFEFTAHTDDPDEPPETIDQASTSNEVDVVFEITFNRPLGPNSTRTVHNEIEETIERRKEHNGGALPIDEVESLAATVRRDCDFIEHIDVREAPPEKTENGDYADALTDY